MGLDTRKYVYRDKDRVSHKTKGLGTVHADPEQDDLIVDEAQNLVFVASEGVEKVYVAWDDDRLPVEPMACFELETLSPGAAVITDGY